MNMELACPIQPLPPPFLLLASLAVSPIEHAAEKCDQWGEPCPPATSFNGPGPIPLHLHHALRTNFAEDTYCLLRLLLILEPSALRPIAGS
jgi:hypothetical protein